MKAHIVHRYKAWGSIGFALLAFAVYGLGVWYMSKQQRLIGEQVEVLALESSREQSMYSVVSLLDDVAEDRTSLKNYFVAPDAAVGFIELLEGLSDVVGTPVLISNVRVDNAHDTTGEGTFVVNVSATGSWRSVYHLLELLNTLPVATTIRSVSLTQASATNDASVWVLRTTLETLLRN